MMTDLRQAMFGEMLDVLIMWFFGSAMQVLVEALVGLTIVRLRILQRSRTDFFLVDPHLGVFDPGLETMQALRRTVGADAGLEK